MNLSPLPIQKFFGNNGRPLAGGLLFTYDAGTSTKVWLDPKQSYKFVLSPPGDTDPPTRPIWTVDDITVAPQAFDNAADDIGSVNNISLIIPQISSPVAFTRVVFKAANTNTGPTTIQINGGTAHDVTLQSGQPLSGGEITGGGIYEAIFDGANWQLQSQLKFPRTEAEIAAGVMPASFAGSSRPWTDAVLRYGLNGDGSTDNLTAFTEMFSVAGQALFIKRGDYVISAPVSIPSNTTLYLEPGTIIRDGGVLPNTSFIRIETVSNVHIIGWGAKVLMDRADYPQDEQRHGVMIRGDCENICIEGLESSNCGGDGFFIGQHASQSVFPQYVRLVGCKADNNRRQGLSITSGRHIYIVDCVFSNSNGTAPQAGIDIEPDASHFVLQDIRLENVTTIGNAQQGIKMYLAPMDNTSDPVSIDVVNHRDVGSAYGLTVHQLWQGCRGNIRIYNPIWERNISFGFAAVSCAPENVLIEVFNPLVIDCNQGGSLSDLSGTAYAVYREAGVPQTGKIGGVHIYEPNVQVTLSNYPVTSFYVQNSDELGEVDDVWIIDPKNVEYTAVAPTLFGGSPVYITDRHRVMRGNFTGALTVTASRYFSHYSNNGASGQVNWDLADWPETESERTFEVHTAQIVNVRANIANTSLRIFPGNYTAMQSNVVGAKITLKRGPGGFWVTNMVGTWAGT